MVASQASCWVASYLYFTYNDDHRDTPAIPESTILSFLGVLVGLWLACTLLFFYKINRAYWSTFYSRQSGRQNAMSYFLENDDDATKSIIFSTNEDLWIDIREEVKVWALKKWNGWSENPPEWFTEAFKERVPDDMMPRRALEDLNKKAGGERRRSSAGF